MVWRSVLTAQIASVVLLLALWHGVAIVAGSTTLPAPMSVLTALGQEIVSGELPYHLGVTLARVAVSFVLAFAIGTAAGIAMGRIEPLDRFLDPWLVLLLNVPALVIIILAYVWFGLIETAAVAAVALNKIPNVVVTLREGARALDRDLMEMARSFRLGRWSTLRHVVLPQMFPYMMASARSGLALIWKIVLVVELLGRSNGVGFQLHLFFQLFDVASILAYTFAFVAVIQVIEWTILQPVEKRATVWRR